MTSDRTTPVDAAQVTAEWWAEQIFGPATDRNAKGLGLTGTADILLGSTMAPMEDRTRFTTAVAEEIRAARRGLPDELPVLLRTDYQPTNEHWPAILAKVLVDTEFFPWKKLTCTWPGRVEVGTDVIWKDESQ